MIVQSGSWSYEVNYVPTTDNEENLTNFVAVLVDAGWTVIGRSDGTTVTSDGSQNSTAEWTNNNAWTHLRDPSGVGGRDLSIERGTTNRSWRTYQSKVGDPMTGGLPAAPPTATGTMAQLGGTVNNFDTSFFPGTPSAARFHIGAAQLPGGTSGDVYSWYIIGRNTPAATSLSSALVLACETPADGALGDADIEPWVGHDGFAFSFNSQMVGWFKAGLTGEAWVNNGGMSDTELTSERGLNPYTGGYDRPGVFLTDITASVVQRKGLIDETILTYRGDGAHGSLDTYNLSTEGSSFAVFDVLAIRWPHSVAPLS